jgi:hypothetical protein
MSLGTNVLAWWMLAVVLGLPSKSGGRPARSLKNRFLGSSPSSIRSRCGALFRGCVSARNRAGARAAVPKLLQILHEVECSNASMTSEEMVRQALASIAQVVPPYAICLWYH